MHIMRNTVLYIKETFVLFTFQNRRVFLVKKDSIREGDFHFTFKNAENELLHIVVDDMLLTELLITHLTLKKTQLKLQFVSK